MIRPVLPRMDAGEGRFRFLVRLLIAVVCAAALLQAMRPAVYSTRVGVQMASNTDPAEPTRRFRQQLDYVLAELHRQVPAGTRVAITDVDLEWAMRLSELATLNGLVVVTDAAEMYVSIEFDQAAPHGVRLLVRQAATG